jgi:hypothetical protein
MTWRISPARSCARLRRRGFEPSSGVIRDIETRSDDLDCAANASRVLSGIDLTATER